MFLLTPGEDGLHTLIANDLLPEIPSLSIPDWDSLLGVVDELTATDHSYKTLVVDTINGAERLCNTSVCDTDFNGDMGPRGFMNYQNGYQAAAMGPWKALLVTLDKLRQTKRMGIILLAHTAIRNFANPEGPDYDRFQPAFDGKHAWQRTLEWADMVLFAKREVVVQKDEKADRKAKGHGGSARVIYTEYSAAYEAKNRHNLPAEISMGTSGKQAWDNFIAAMKQGREAKHE